MLSHFDSSWSRRSSDVKELKIMATLYKMPIDLYRDGDRFVLNADLPGIDPSSVDLDVDGALLTIRAERVAPSAEGVRWLTRENRSGSFVRHLTLGDGVDREN